METLASSASLSVRLVLGIEPISTLNENGIVRKTSQSPRWQDLSLLLLLRVLSVVALNRVKQVHDLNE